MAEPLVARVAVTEPTAAISRRHDLDALRAIAMLAGIALHSMLAYVPGLGDGWPVKDIHQHAGFDIAIASLHGFRMQLFFLISGFFTAMLWRKRGLSALMTHRVKRILLPLMIGMVTIIPATWFAAIGSGIYNAQRLQQIKTAVVKHDAATEHPEVAAAQPEWPGGSTEQGKPIDPFDQLVANMIGTEQSEFVFGMTKLILGLGLIPVFHHLWFLWFLCFLVAGFSLYARPIGERSASAFSSWIVTPLRYAWLIPLTLLPQACMGLMYPNFGPDTSPGLLPLPYLLFYYGIFFFFGALYFDCDDQTGRLGRYWRFTLPVALIVIFPIGYEFSKGGLGVADLVPESFHRTIAVIAQVLYAWLMTFGLMGIFRNWFSRESKRMRYVSDSSYWLYVAHLPLVFVLQAVVCDWPLSAVVKCILVSVVCCLLLLASYQLLVRHTPIGTLLNGPRKRISKDTIPTATLVTQSARPIDE